MSDSLPPSAPEPPLPDWVGPLLERAREADGHPPFSDQALVDARSGASRLLVIEPTAVAIVGDGEAELVVDPDARRRGHGASLLEAVIAQSRPGLLVWAHGDGPAARALAARFGFEPVRRLLQLRAPVPEAPIGGLPDGITYFDEHADEDAWLDLNARAFASHPEQGSVSGSDLESLMGEPWFDAHDFLVARDGERMVGYNWLKVDPSTGSGTAIAEIYVLGIDPERQGEGLGRRLLEAGFARMRERGIRTATLYVEADNVPAIALYESAGFSEYSADVQYRLARFTPRPFTSR